MAQIFISYASADRERARRLADVLQQQGLTVWWDRHIVAGQTFDDVIERALNAAACVVVLWSAASVKSNWVKTEAADAAARGMLVPVLMDNVKIPLEFRRVQAANLTAWDGDIDDSEFQHFLQAVRLAVEQNTERQATGAVPAAMSPAVARAAALARSAEAVVPVASVASVPQREPAAPSDPGRGSRRAILISSAVSAIVAAAAVAFWFSRAASIALPNVVGLTDEEAAAALRMVNMIPQRQEQLSAADEPGTVVSQNPAAGTPLAAGSTVMLTIAMRPAVVAADGSAAAANAAEPAVMPGSASEIAAAAEPAPVPLVTVPDVRGQSVEDATRLLMEAGLTIGNRSEEASNDLAIGAVVAQNPAAAQTAPHGAPVDVTVVVRRAVPELTGLSLDEARAALQRLGLRDRIERVRASRGERDNQVVKQQPAVGEPVEPGSETLLTIATTAPKRLFGGERLFTTNGQRCVEVCKAEGLVWRGQWSGSTNSCTCDF